MTIINSWRVMGKCVHGFHGEFATIKGFYAIMVVVERFTKMAHFIPTKENAIA